MEHQKHLEDIILADDAHQKAQKICEVFKQVEQDFYRIAASTKSVDSTIQIPVDPALSKLNKSHRRTSEPTSSPTSASSPTTRVASPISQPSAAGSNPAPSRSTGQSSRLETVLSTKPAPSALDGIESVPIV
ncbi:hypothetical protein DXG01_014107 [Tephrocybe rancida]|nr:hypothetical protein DXG01_014107 [Tephrocybe rancida]